MQYPNGESTRVRGWSTKLLAALVMLTLLATACGEATNGDVSADPAGTGSCGPGFTPPGTGAAGSASDSPTAEELVEQGVLAAPGTLDGRIEGAGATFPNPLYQDWAFDYANPASGVARQPDVTIEYQSIGSGGGIEQFLRDTQDWGTSERYLRDDALDEASENRGGTTAVQVPIVYGSVVIAFADPRFDGLILDAETISAIFRREITKYNDPRIAELNPDCPLPDLDIVPVHRSDGSGTTSVFTTWLEDEDEVWADELGSGTEVDWAAGTVGGQGNEGVTSNLRNAPGGLGYVNQAYALENDLPQARVINADGNPIYPTLQATTAAIEALTIPDNFQFDILGVGADGFPITGTVWNFYYTSGYDATTAAILKDFWIWATQTQEADELALQLGYAPLGASLKARVLDALERVNEDG